MYRVKLNGNYNVCVSDLDTIFTATRSEKSFSDKEFENSEDIKKYIGKFLSVEYVKVKAANGGQVQKAKKEKTAFEVKTKIEESDGKDRIVIEEKNPVESNIFVADKASSTVSLDEKTNENNDIVIADACVDDVALADEHLDDVLPFDFFGKAV
jgi:hypothetical protein